MTCLSNIWDEDNEEAQQLAQNWEASFHFYEVQNVASCYSDYCWEFINLTFIFHVASEDQKFSHFISAPTFAIMSESAINVII